MAILKRLAALAAVAVLASSPALATSFVPMADETLLRQADLVVVGRIVARDERASATRPATRYLVDVEEALKGAAPRTLAFAVPGGVDGAGRRLEIDGAPRFESGERAILFLSNGPRGWQLTQFTLGAFVEAASDAGPLAVRQLANTDSIGGVDPQAVGLHRDFARFAAYLRGVAAQAAPAAAPEYFVAAEPARAKFNRMAPPRRWFEFDEAREVTWFANSAPEADTPGGGYLPFQRALQAWNADRGSNTLLVYGGKVTNTNGFDSFDGVNVILFNDPTGEIAGSFTCGAGGVLAIGGPWTSSETRTHDGESWNVIVGGEVITQDGAGCVFASLGGTRAEQVFSHEVGHALGFSHSCGDGGTGACSAGTEADAALMRATAHNDWRGARLGFDDQSGAAAVYGQAPRPTLARLADGRLAVLLVGSDGASVRVRIFDPATGALQATQEYGATFAPLALAGLADVNGNGSADVAVLGIRRLDGDVIVDVRDGASGALVVSIRSWDTSFEPLDLVAVDADHSGNGKPEVALLATRISDGAVRLETRDAFSGALVSRAGYTRGHRPLALRHLPDSDGDGSDEAAVLGTVPTTGKLAIEVRDLVGGGLVGTTLAASAFRPEAMRETASSALIVAGDLAGDDAPELGVIGVSADSGRLRLEVDEVATAASVTVRSFSSTFPNLLYATPLPADLSGNGALEVAYVLRQNDTAAVRAELRDLATGELAGRIAFNAAFYPEGLAAIADTNANGAPELVLLQRKLDSGALRLEIRDASSGTLLRTIAVAR